MTFRRACRGQSLFITGLPGQFTVVQTLTSEITDFSGMFTNQLLKLKYYEFKQNLKDTQTVV